MVKFIILIIAVCGVILGKSKYKSIINPYTIFNFFWIIVSVLLMIGNKYIYEPKNNILIYILIGVLSYNFSFFLPKLIYNRDEKKENRYEYSIKIVKIVSGITIVLSFIVAQNSIVSLLNGTNFSDIRAEYYGDSGGNIMYYIRSYITMPLEYVTIIMNIIVLFKDNVKRKWKYAFNIILTSFLMSVANGGRFILMNTMFMIICGFIMLSKNKKIKFKNKLYIILAIGIFAYGIIYLTNDRSTYIMQKMNLWEKIYITIYEYFAGSVVFFDKVTQAYPHISSSTYGLNFIGGFISPIFVIFNGIHLISYPEAFNIIGKYVCDQLWIGPDMSYNAIPTIFAYFYIDGGPLAIFFESLIFGYISKLIYEKSIKREALFTAFYFLIFIQICNSSTRWFFYTPEFCLAFIYLRCVFKKIKISNINYEGE